MTRADACWDVPTAAALRRLVAEPLPFGLQGQPVGPRFHRDLYLDTADGALRQRGATCRFRLRTDERCELLVSLLAHVNGRPELRKLEAAVVADEPRSACEGPSEPARLLRGLVSPAALDVQLDLETERHTRELSAGWLRRARFELTYDVVTVRAAGLARTFQEVDLREVRAGKPSFEQLSRALREAYALRTITTDRPVRGALLRAALESEALARAVGSGQWVVIIALDGLQAACIVDGDMRRLPIAEGRGEDACRHLMRHVLGSAVGDLHLLSTVRTDGRWQSLEVWIATHVERSARPERTSNIEWMPVADLQRRVGSSLVSDPPTVAALTTFDRSGLLAGLSETPAAGSESETGYTADFRTVATDPAMQAVSAEEPLLDGDLSLLAFNERVLALAESKSVPLLERVRYLSIVNANLDEFFMVRMGGMKYGSLEVAAEAGGQVAGPRLEAISRRVRTMIARQYRCIDVCRQALAEAGIFLRAPAELSAAQRDYLRTYFRSTVFPYLTPRAITATPGLSFPLIPDLTLCMVVMARGPHAGAARHIGDLVVPAAVPRFVRLPDSDDFVALEDVIRHELDALYPGRRVEHAYLFRVTRYADLDVDERHAGNLAQAIAESTQRRRHQPVVRVEVERAMPAAIRDRLLHELQLEPGAQHGVLGADEVYEIDGLMDPGALRQIAGLPRPELRFPPFQPNAHLDVSRPLWETLREHDVLLHHPYDAFSSTVERFFDEAADDPDVAAIRVTLYRAGERSPIVDALARAAKAGKDVTAFVELKARFDEERNVTWAKHLEAAGVHVVHGVQGVKNHAKVAMVVRREDGIPRRYVHVGTGNYNAETARAYTDFGLLTARETLCADVNDLFNALTGSSALAAHPYRDCLVAPAGLLPGLIERIEREADHARSGRGGQIRMKLNGLSDADVVRALYRAARAGVEIELIVRGICTLSPGAAGTADRIRVVSLLGRFLEHARVVVFANGGDPEYFIGSADLRPRNLRRRVEVLAPVHEPRLRARLDGILDRELADPTAWVLAPDGTYAQPPVTPNVTGRTALAPSSAAYDQPAGLR